MDALYSAAITAILVSGFIGQNLDAQSLDKQSSVDADLRSRVDKLESEITALKLDISLLKKVELSSSQANDGKHLLAECRKGVTTHFRSDYWTFYSC